MQCSGVYAMVGCRYKVQVLIYCSGVDLLFKGFIECSSVDAMFRCRCNI